MAWPVSLAAAPLRRRPEAHGVLEQMALHLPVHVYIQACLRYMHMARDCAAPPAHSEYNLAGGGRKPASRPIPRPLF